MNHRKPSQGVLSSLQRRIVQYQRQYRYRPALILLTLLALIGLTAYSTPSLSTASFRSGSSSALSTTGSGSGGRTKRRLQVIQAGGIPKEGLGSTLGFIRARANIAYLLDADFLISQTAHMMDYRASEILNKGVELNGGGRVCDIMEVLLEQPGYGDFRDRMTRAQSTLDETYKRALRKCTTHPNDEWLTDYAKEEIARCDVLIINDYRIYGGPWTRCNMAWWKPVIDQYSGPAHGNDIAIHFRWGDMYHVSQIEAKWKTDMNKMAPLIDIIRKENPSVVVNVYMKRSEENESEQRMREILMPLSGDYNIIEAAEDVEELSMMGKARYLFLNSGSFSTAAAATNAAQVVVWNNGGAQHAFEEMQTKNVFNYDDMDIEEFRLAVRP